LLLIFSISTVLLSCYKLEFYPIYTIYIKLEILPPPPHRSLYITVLSTVLCRINSTHPLCAVPGLMNSTLPGLRTVPTRYKNSTRSHKQYPQSGIYTDGLMNSTWHVTVSHFPLSLLLLLLPLGKKTLPVLCTGALPVISIFIQSILVSRSLCFFGDRRVLEACLDAKKLEFGYCSTFVCI
jgi:hypothetical protein